MGAGMAIFVMGCGGPYMLSMVSGAKSFALLRCAAIHFGTLRRAAKSLLRLIFSAGGQLS
jgi:hypothetical protein